MPRSTKDILFKNLFISALFLYLFLIGTTISSRRNLRNSLDVKKKDGKVIKTINLSSYEYPKNDEKNKTEIIIAILGTNDIHGQAFEKDEIQSGSEGVLIGGFKLLSGVIDKIRSEFGDNFLWLDAGDQFTGTVEKELTKGKLIVDFYNIMKVNAVTIGNHEWDQKEDQLRSWMNSELGAFFDKNKTNWTKENYGKAGKNLYLTANLKPKKNTKKNLPNLIPTRLFEFANGKIKIGVIGLITKETFEKTAGFDKTAFEILDYKHIVESQAKKLRNSGANAVIILSHIGAECKNSNINEAGLDELHELKLRDKSYIANGKCVGEMMSLLEEIDESLIDGVVAGHIHTSVHHFYDHIPIIQNPNNNIFANIMYLKFKKNEKGEYSIQRENSLIEGPIPLCSKIYSTTKSCYSKQELQGDATLVDFTFHGSKLIPNKNVVDLFTHKYKNINEKILKLKNNIIAETEVYLERDTKNENILGNLIADFVRKLTKADVSLVSPGSLRYYWAKGIISEYSLYNMFPFGGKFGSYKVKGKDLKEVIKQVQKGSLGYLYSFSGLKMTYQETNGTCTIDENSIVLDNGKPIENHKDYYLGSSIFILTGGDDMSKFKTPHPDGYLNMTISKGPFENKVNILKSIEAELKHIGLITKEKAQLLLGRIKLNKSKN